MLRNRSVIRFTAYFAEHDFAGLRKLAAAWDRSMASVVRILVMRELKRIGLPADGKCPTCGIALSPRDGAVACRESTGTNPT